MRLITAGLVYLSGVGRAMVAILAFPLLTIACIVTFAFALVWMLCAAIVGSRRWYRIAVAFDQLANATFAGDEDETISARAWRCRDSLRYSALVQIINLGFGDSRHCESAYLQERIKRTMKG